MVVLILVVVLVIGLMGSNSNQQEKYADQFYRALTSYSFSYIYDNYYISEGDEERISDLISYDIKELAENYDGEKLYYEMCENYQVWPEEKRDHEYAGDFKYDYDMNMSSEAYVFDALVGAESSFDRLCSVLIGKVNGEWRILNFMCSFV